jgi:hypothetical protein
MSATALKAKYPDMSDEDIARNISMVLDENGNYRSSLYQNYMTGKNAGIDSGKIDDSLTQYDSMAQDQYGKPIASSVRYKPTDSGILDIEEANSRNKITNVANQGAIAAWNAAEAAGVNPINKSDDPDTNNQFLTHQSQTPSNNLDTAAISKAVANIQGNTGNISTPTQTSPTQPSGSTSTKTNGIDTANISKALSDIQAKTNVIAAQVPTTTKTTTTIPTTATPKVLTSAQITEYYATEGKKASPLSPTAWAQSKGY